MRLVHLVAVESLCDFVCLHVCLPSSFSRLIQVVNEGQDLNLDVDYFLLLGRGETPGNYICLIQTNSDPSATAVKQVLCLPV